MGQVVGRCQALLHSLTMDTAHGKQEKQTRKDFHDAGVLILGCFLSARHLLFRGGALPYSRERIVVVSVVGVLHGASHKMIE